MSQSSRVRNQDRPATGVHCEAEEGGVAAKNTDAGLRHGLHSLIGKFGTTVIAMVIAKLSGQCKAVGAVPGI